MSDTTEKRREITPTRFLIYLGAAALGFIVSLFVIGTVLTHFLWPTENSHPNITQPK